MSRLALRGSSTSQRKFGALGLPKHAAGTPATAAAAKSAPGGGAGQAAAAGGGAGQAAAAAAAASPACSRDSWDTSSSEDDEARQCGRQQENRRPQPHAQPQPGTLPCGAGGAERRAPANTPLDAPPSSSAQPPSHSKLIQELYEVDDSEEEGWEAEPPAAGMQQPTQPAPAAPAAGGAQHPPAPPASPACCPVCGCKLEGVGLEQQQQHINACLDGASVQGRSNGRSAVLEDGSVGRAQPVRPCHQQDQQQPASMQWQQQQQRQPSGRPDQQQQSNGGAAGRAGSRGGAQPQQAPPPGQQTHPGQQPRGKDAAGGSSKWAAQGPQLQQPAGPRAAQAAAGQPARAPPPAEEPSAGPACKVCGASLSHLGLQEQVTHVKNCMAGRGRNGKAAKPAKPAAQPAAAQPPPAWPQQQQRRQQQQQEQQQQQQQQPAVDEASALQSMDVGQWLKALGLERYHSTFVEQELDLTCLHAVTAEELAGIGVADRLHQVRILQAADALATQLGLRRPRSRGSSANGRQQPAAKKQRQLTLAVGPAPGGPSPAAGPAAGMAGRGQGQYAGQPAQHLQGGVYQPQPAQQQQQAESGVRDAGPRPQERAMLSRLYGQQTQGQPQHGQQQQQQRTPQLLGRGRSISRGSHAGAASLWAGAGACVPVAPLLGDRLAQREAEEPEAAAAAKREPLARGGATAYPAAEESRALKRVRLDALRQELRTHEETAAALRAMIAQLEREVGEAPGG